MRNIYNDLYVIENIGTANIFCVGTTTEFILIDTGIFMKTKYLVEDLNQNGFKLENLKTIILTHCHCDHIGGVRDLVDNSNAKVAAHKEDIPYILQQKIIDGPYHGMMIEEQKAMKQLKKEVENVDVILSDNDFIESFKVIHVPGHTPGSIALYNEDNKSMLFGDVIRENKKDGLSIGKPEKFNLNTEQVKRDAKKLLNYSIKYALLSHGHIYINNEIEMLEKLLKNA
jgi:hydroxyacylglutathione hydrolase